MALTATGFFPANQATGICVDTPIKITFDASPTVGTTGSIRIYNSNGSLVETLDLAVPHTRTIGGTVHNGFPVLVNGNTASIFPRSGVLAYNTTYFVTIDASVFPGYPAITSNTVWRFTTKAAPPSSSATYLVVAADGRGDFCTVQGAIDFIPANNTTKRFINIRNGSYQEIVRVTSKHHLVFRGQNRKYTIISYPNNSNLNPSTNTRPLFNAVANDITIDNITLHNTTPKGGSQAESLRVNGQRCVVHQCDLRSFQDTVLINSATDTAYFKDSLVEGDVDFIWGTGRVVFQSCEIRSVSGGYVCQMRNPSGQYGAVFLGCRFTRAPGVTGVVLARIDPNVFPHSSVALVDCAMDAHISAAAWQITATGPTSNLRFWEYLSRDLSGNLISTSGRASFSAQISASQAAALGDLPSVLGGWTPIPPPPAFPGAEGAGSHALGGRGGDVYIVSNLNDSGPGSLRDGIANAPAGGRTIVFRTSGTIALNSALTLSRPQVTIAGQTAPGDGIALRNYTLRIQGHDAVVRHLRSRLGTGAGVEDDAITIRDAINVMVDHCSASWSVDEVFSCTGGSDNVTVQWSMVTEALHQSIHSKGSHGFGSIIASNLPARFSWCHNLYAHNQSRNPRVGSLDGATIELDFRNNLLYNWGYFCGYTGDRPEASDLNYVGNYLVKGPSSTTDSAFRGGGTTSRIHQSGNVIDLNRNGVFDGTDTGWSMISGTYTRRDDPFVFSHQGTVLPAAAAMQRVISGAGAMPWRRDSKDAAIAANVIAGSGGSVDTTDQAGGYPVLYAEIPPADSDNDGMPDYWEAATGGNPAQASNNNDANGDGVTDLEDFLNWVAEPHAVTEADLAVDVDLDLMNGRRSGPAYTVTDPFNGSVVLLGDGRTARFTPTPGFVGLAGFTFRFSATGQTIARSVGIVVTDALPTDLEWSGVTSVWDVQTTPNFLDDSGPSLFRQGDAVRFLQSGGQSSVSMTGALAPSSMTVDATKDYAFGGNGSLTGAMTLAKSGAGRLTLSTANSFTGGLMASGGSVVMGTVTSLGSGPIQLQGTDLHIDNFNITNPVNVSGDCRVVGRAFAKLKSVSGDGNVTLDIASSPFDLTGDMTGFNGSMSVSGNINIRLLSGTTGAPNASFNLGQGTGNITVRNNLPTVALGALSGGPGTLLLGQSNDNKPTTFTIGGNDQDSVFQGGIRNGTSGSSAVVSITKTGSGSLTLQGASTYTGPTRVEAGSLVVNGSLGATAVTVLDGANLGGTGTLGGSVEILPGGSIEAGSGGAGNLSIAGDLTLSDTTLAVDLGATDTPADGNDRITTGGTLRFSGTISISPNFTAGTIAPGTYTIISGGVSTVNSATFVWNGPPNGGRQNVAIDTSVPGTLRLIVSGAPPANLVWQAQTGNVWDSADPANPTSGSANWLNGESPDRFFRFDRVVFNDSANPGNVVVSGSVEPAAWKVENTNRAYVIDSTSGGIAGSVRLEKSGPGLLTLTGTNQHTGGILATAGTVAISSAGAAGSGIIRLENATFQVGALKPPNAFEIAGNSFLIGGSNSGLGGIGTLTGDGQLNLTITGSAFDLIGDGSGFNGILRVTSNNTLRMVGSAGGPRFGLDLGPGSASLSSRSGTPAIAFGSLAGGPSTIVRGASNHAVTTIYTIGGDHRSTVFAGSIQNGTHASSPPSAVVKIGDGILTLAGNSTHTGPTRVEDGTLNVTGTLVASPVEAVGAAELAGTGSIPSLRLVDEATLSPGDAREPAGATGLLMVAGNMEFATDAVGVFDLGTASDQVQVGGDLSLDGTLNLRNAGGLVASSYTLFQYSGNLTTSGARIGLVPDDFSATIDTQTPGHVKVTLVSTLTPFQQWQVQWFGDRHHPDAAGTADPDGDGQINEDEFSAGTDPTSAASAPTLFWRGDGSANAWDKSMTDNFWNGFRRTVFTNGNAVVFDASGAANPIVTLSEALSPGSTVVDTAVPMTFNGPGILAGSGNLTKSGSGALSISSGSRFTGGTFVNAGTLNLTGDHSEATGGYTVNPANSATSTINMGTATQSSMTRIAVGSGSSLRLGAVPGVDVASGNSAQVVNAIGALGFATEIVNSGSLSVARNATLGISNHAIWSQSGTVNVQANGGYPATLNIGSGPGSNGSMVYSGGNPLRISQVTGTTGISTMNVRGGMLTTSQPIEFAGASGNASGFARFVLSGGGRLKLSADIPQLAVGDASGRMVLSNNGGGIIDTNGFQTTIDRPLVDSNPVTFIGSLTKAGEGTLRLSAPCTYSGSTSVLAGILMVNGSILTPTTVSGSGTLSGIGSAGPVNLTNGGSLAPGDSIPGTLRVGSVAMDASATMVFRLGFPCDKLEVTGNGSLGGTFRFVDSGATAPGRFRILSCSGTLTGLPVVIPPAGFSARLETPSPGQLDVVLEGNLYATWARGQFSPGELADPSVSGPLASPAGDGLPNHLKFALGLPAKNPSVTGILPVRQADAIGIVYQRPGDRPGLSYSVLASPSLAPGSWSASGIQYQRVGNGPIETWEATLSPVPPGPMFFRLEVSGF